MGLFTVIFYGVRNFCCKTAQFCDTRRKLDLLGAGLPYGVPVPGRKAMVTSPYAPEEGKYVDVTGFASGSVVKDPYTGKLFLVP